MKLQLIGGGRGERGRGPAFTLAEVLVSMAVMSLLLVGVAAAVGVSARAISGRGDASSAAAGAAAAVAVMVDDLSCAIGFTELSATAVEFTVADRNGDGLVETIRYEWKGSEGSPLERVYNGVKETLAGVEELEIRYQKRAEVTQEWNVSITNTTDALAASFDGWSGISSNTREYQVSYSDSLAQYFEINSGLIPAGASNIRLTRVSLLMRQTLLGSTVTTVAIHRPAAAGSPIPAATRIGNESSINMGLLSSVTSSWVDVPLSNVNLGANDRQLVIVVKGTGGGSGNVTYQEASSAPVDPWIMLTSSNAGSSWVPTDTSRYNRMDARFAAYVSYSTETRTQVPVTRHYLETVEATLKSPGSGAGAVSGVARVLNRPEVSP